VVLKIRPREHDEQNETRPEPEGPASLSHRILPFVLRFLRKQSCVSARPARLCRGFAAFWRLERGPDVCSDGVRRFSVSNKVISMAAAQRPGRSALEEFLPELDLQPNVQNNHVDPREIHLEPVGPVSDVTTGPGAADNSGQVQLWPMLAAALVGIGVMLLGFGVYSRFEGL